MREVYVVYPPKTEEGMQGERGRNLPFFSISFVRRRRPYRSIVEPIIESIAARTDYRFPAAPRNR